MGENDNFNPFAVNSTSRSNNAKASDGNTYHLQEQNDNPLATEVPRPPTRDHFNLPGSKESDAAAKIATAKAQAQALEGQRKSALVAASLQAVTDVMSSQTQYEAIKGASDTNIYLMNHQKSLIMAAGRQAAADRNAEGDLNADTASLSLAAQGQSLNGAGADKVTSSYRAMAMQAAAHEEAKMYADMAGVEMQIANQEYNVDMADNAADMSLYQGILNVGMSTAGYYAGKA